LVQPTICIPLPMSPAASTQYFKPRPSVDSLNSHSGYTVSPIMGLPRKKSNATSSSMSNNTASITLPPRPVNAVSNTRGQNTGQTVQSIPDSSSGRRNSQQSKYGTMKGRRYFTLTTWDFIIYLCLSCRYHSSDSPYYLPCDVEECDR